MMLNNLVLGLILTVFLYLYNNSTGRLMDNTQYALIFIALSIGISLVYRFLTPPGTAAPSVLNMLGLEPPSHGPNGEQVIPCYNVPFKVMQTQYGDRALMAGYNENVIAAQTGADGLYESPSQMPVASECVNVTYKATKV